MAQEPASGLMIYASRAILSFFNSQSRCSSVAVVSRIELSLFCQRQVFAILCLVLFVCWKSRKSPTARGRISIELSMDDLPIEFPADPVDKPAQVRRGWWDYVPEPQEVPPIVDTKENPAEAVNEKNSGTVKGFFRRVKSPASTQKSKVVANGPRNKTQQAPVPAIRNSLAPSSMSRLSRLIPRMELFRQVMKDEVNFHVLPALFTTLIFFSFSTLLLSHSTVLSWLFW